MTIECYRPICKHHCNNSGDEGPFCYEAECNFEPLTSGMSFGFAADLSRLGGSLAFKETDTGRGAKIYIPNFFDDELVQTILVFLKDSVPESYIDFIDISNVIRNGYDLTDVHVGDIVVVTHDLPPSGWSGLGEGDEVSATSGIISFIQYVTNSLAPFCPIPFITTCYKEMDGERADPPVYIYAQVDATPSDD